MQYNFYSLGVISIYYVRMTRFCCTALILDGVLGEQCEDFVIRSKHRKNVLPCEHVVYFHCFNTDRGIIVRC